MLQPINPKAYNLRAEIGRLLIEFVISRKREATARPVKSESKPTEANRPEGVRDESH